MKQMMLLFLPVSLLMFVHSTAAQEMAIGGRGGFSVFSSTLGIQIGPTFDYKFQPGWLVGSEFNINTQGGTPVEWGNYVKYLMPSTMKDVQPYLDGGFGLWFVTGGPYFGLRAGGGAWFKIAPDMYVPADIQLGPVFSSGSNVFYFAITSGIRYVLPM